jgi:hypothetical protein
MSLVKNKSRNKDSKKWSRSFSRRTGRVVINEFLNPPVEIPMRVRLDYIYGDEH